MKFIPALTLLVLFPLTSIAGSFSKHSKTVEKSTDASALVFAISTATEIEILTIDPVLPDKNKEPAASPSNTLGGFRILRSAPLSDSKQIHALAESLGKAIEAGKSSAYCFSPRHGLRATTADGEIRILVCFECRAIRVEGFKNVSFAPIDSKVASTVWESVFASHIPAPK